MGFIHYKTLARDVTYKMLLNINTSGQNVTSANGGAGGGGSTTSGNPNAGISNTGSGGSAAANGGSGLVIVRYLRSAVGG